jgi:Uncharacterized conserved protein
MKTVALIGALDTKGAEYAFVKECLEARGHRTLVIDCGVLGEPALTPDIERSEVARAGNADLESLVARADRGAASQAMAAGLVALLPRLLAEGRFDGVMALGGTGGTSVACAAMRALPLGVPKVMVSTVAGTDVSAYVGVSDIVMVPSIVDVSGVNRISRGVFARAAGAMAGMLETEVPEGTDRPLIAASMFGNTTQAVETAKAVLEKAGYEVLVFHATGNGGRSMENLIAEGHIAGVLDITTTELADELAGGVFSAGPDRLGAAAARGVPAIVAPGCLDMVNFGVPESVPARYKGRLFYQHNANVTLMRTDIDESQRLGAQMAAKLNASRAPVTVLLPLRGLSVIGAPGGPFHWPEADAALFEALRRDLRPDIPVIEMDCEVNAPEFAHRCAAELLANLGNPGGAAA